MQTLPRENRESSSINYLCLTIWCAWNACPEYGQCQDSIQPHIVCTKFTTCGWLGTQFEANIDCGSRTRFILAITTVQLKFTLFSCQVNFAVINYIHSLLFSLSWDMRAELHSFPNFIPNQSRDVGRSIIVRSSVAIPAWNSLVRFIVISWIPGIYTIYTCTFALSSFRLTQFLNQSKFASIYRQNVYLRVAIFRKWFPIVQGISFLKACDFI